MKIQKLRTMFPAVICRSFPLIFFSVLLLLFLLSSSLYSANRVALVIGNGGYSGEGKLASPVKDANAMAKALEAAGFQVILAENSSLMEMDKVLLEFSGLAKGADAAWFFFAGHGIQVKGKNYLIPIDAQVKKESQVRYMAMGLSQVFSAMERTGVPLKVVVLDCCRENLFTKNWTPPATPGLNSVEASEGSIVAFSAPPGQLRQDGDESNSPFTEAMISAMKTGETNILQVFSKAGELLGNVAGEKQKIQVYQSFDKSFVLMEKGGKKGAILKSEPETTPPSATKPEVAAATKPASNSTTVPLQVTSAAAMPLVKPLPKEDSSNPASTAMINRKPKVLSISSSTSSTLPESTAPAPAAPMKNLSAGNLTAEIPVAVPAPGQPDFSNKGFYSNSKVFKGGPFESGTSLTVYVELMKDTQRQLLGEDKVTGWMNYETQLAILKLQQDRKVPVTGLIDYQTAGILKLKLPKPGASGNESHSAAAGSSPPKSDSNGIPNGSNVPGKPGIVYSPYSPGKPIDARGRKAGEKVTDPFTNQAFLLPKDFNSGSRYLVPGKAYSTTTGPNGSKRKMIPGRFYNGLGIGESESLQNQSRQKQQEMLRKVHKK